MEDGNDTNKQERCTQQLLQQMKTQKAAPLEFMIVKILKVRVYCLQLHHRVILMETEIWTPTLKIHRLLLQVCQVHRKLQTTITMFYRTKLGESDLQVLIREIAQGNEKSNALMAKLVSLKINWKGEITRYKTSSDNTDNCWCRGFSPCCNCAVRPPVRFND